MKKEHKPNCPIWVKVNNRSGIEAIRPFCECWETLEESIKKLWESRDMEVIKEIVEGKGDGTYQWTIIAKVKK